jgi:hypothetical protein
MRLSYERYDPQLQDLIYKLYLDSTLLGSSCTIYLSEKTKKKKKKKKKRGKSQAYTSQWVNGASAIYISASFPKCGWVFGHIH